MSRQLPAQEWRWVDEQGRAMTNWKAGDPPPMASVSDAKGEMRVEVRYVAPSTSIDTEAEADG